jgi:hypothetical protein
VFCKLFLELSSYNSLNTIYSPLPMYALEVDDSRLLTKVKLTSSSLSLMSESNRYYTFK